MVYEDEGNLIHIITLVPTDELVTGCDKQRCDLTFEPNKCSNSDMNNIHDLLFRYDMVTDAKDYHNPTKASFIDYYSLHLILNTPKEQLPLVRH